MLYAKGVLLDTGALFALVKPNDIHHVEAVNCLNCLQKDSHPLFVSNATIYETYRLILHELGIRKALDFLEDIFDGSVRIEYVTPNDEEKAKAYLKQFDDKPLTFVDALNFVVMKRINIFKVFAFDQHFNFLGFIKIPPYYPD
jgi:predicted nucleic acid-binding protein